MDRMLFVNIAVNNLEKSVEFFTKLGFEFDASMTNEEGTAMKINANTFVMLLTKEKFAQFIPAGQSIADPATSTGALLCISAESAQAVKDLTQTAFEAGATPCMPSTEMDFMYGSSFYDLDGNHWEVMWMDAEKMFA